VNIETMLLSALTAGLFGSLHCAGMCGGIASALGMSMKQSSENTQSVSSQPVSFQPLNMALFFQLGRISSYFVAGCIAGYFGDVITQATLFKNVAVYLRLFSALFLVGLGLYLAGFFPFFSIIEKLGVPVWRKISPLSRYLLPVKNIFQAYGLGFLWGWLPCGLTYSILLWSITAGSAIEGGLLMLAFGLGTIPAMLPLTLGAGKVVQLVKQPTLRKIVGLIIVVAGLFVLQNSIMMLNMQVQPSSAMHHH